MTNIIQTNISKLQKLLKYILIGLIVVFVTKYIPNNKLQTKEIIMIGITSSITFAILDIISPSVSIYTSGKTSRQGIPQEQLSDKGYVEAFDN
jgi:hypothetical protein